MPQKLLEDLLAKLKNLFEEKDYSQIFTMYKQLKMNNVKPPLEMYQTLFQIIFLTGKVEMISGLINDMLGFQIPISTKLFNLIIDTYGHQKMLFDVDRVVLLMKTQNVPMDAETYNIIVNALARRLKVFDMREFLNQMKERNIPIYPSTIKNVVLSCSKAGTLIDAEIYLKQYGSLVETDINFITIVIQFYSKFGNLEKIRKYLKILQEKKFPKNLEIYNSLLNLYAKRSLWDDFWKTFEEMKSSRSVNRESFEIVLEHCIVGKNISYLHQFQNEMKSFGLLPDRKCYISLLNAAIQSHCINYISFAYSVIKANGSYLLVSYANIFLYNISHGCIFPELRPTFFELKKSLRSQQGDQSLFPNEKKKFLYLLQEIVKIK